MINTHVENIVTMTEATRYRPLRVNFGRYSVRTLKRWAQYGKDIDGGGRAFLETVRMPSGTCTSHEAIDRFIAKLNGGGEVVAVLYDKSTAQAEQELAALGFAD